MNKKWDNSKRGISYKNSSKNYSKHSAAINKNINKINHVSDLAELEKSINYKFSNISLLKLALTHRSLSVDSNERLEFLGDAILNLIISDYLFSNYPNAREGFLSRVRARIIRKKTLAKIAHNIDVSKYVKVASSEKKYLVDVNSSINSDAIEAIIGAVYSDGGMAVTEDLIMKLFKEELENIDVNLKYKDYKTMLQELIQSHYQSIPQYEMRAERKLKNNTHEFSVLCVVPSSVKNEHLDFIGKGSSRKEAEQEAARIALDQLSKSSS